MESPTTFQELRDLLSGRNHSPFDFLVGEDETWQHSSEAAFVVMPIRGGGFRVTLRERDELLYDQTFPDEASTVAALSRRLSYIPEGPPTAPSEEQLAASRRRVEERKAESRRLALEHRRLHGDR